MGSRIRAASTVEYALILVAILLLAAGSFKLLGGKVGARSSTAGDVVAGTGSPAGGGGGSTGGDKPAVGSKVSMGGVGGVTGDGATKTATSNGEAARPGGDVSEGFTGKRWMGIGLLSAGVIAIGYVLASMRRAKKAADALGKDAGGPKRRRPA